MINWFSKTVWLVLLAAFVLVGCEQQYKEDESFSNLLSDPNFVVPDYASRALKATGGRRAWIKAGKLKFDCVVTFYQQDGSFYLTEQHHEVYPRPNSILVSAREPKGRFVWQLLADSFNQLEGPKRIEAPFKVCDRDFAEAILKIITAPVRFFDGSAVFTRIPTPIKMGGLWHYPIEQATAVRSKQEGVEPVEPYWSKVVLYQNKDSSLVDMLWFADVDEQKFLAVRGYDYKEVEKGSVWVPTKIELFRTDIRGTLLERVVKIDYHSLSVKR